MGGIRLVDKVCDRCKINYKGIHNQKLCHSCKLDGYDKVCKNCNTKFISVSYFTNHCSSCSEQLVWKTKKFPERGKHITESKLKFYQTERGKEVAKRVGRINSTKMKEYYMTDAGKAQRIAVAKKNSLTLKQKILNGTFTPKITNSFTHWDARVYINDTVKKFRSSWEACIWYTNQSWLYEYIRIPYINSKGDKCTYIVDFYDDQNKILYEVKPKSNIKDNILKAAAAEQYCMEHNLQYILITEDNLLNYIDINIFEGENKKQLEKCLK